MAAAAVFFLGAALTLRPPLPTPHSSAKDLYKKFDELLDGSASNVKAGDRVTGTVTGCVVWFFFSCEGGGVGP